MLYDYFIWKRDKPNFRSHFIKIVNFLFLIVDDSLISYVRAPFEHRINSDVARCKQNPEFQSHIVYRIVNGRKSWSQMIPPWEAWNLIRKESSAFQILQLQAHCSINLYDPRDLRSSRKAVRAALAMEKRGDVELAENSKLCHRYRKIFCQKTMTPRTRRIAPHPREHVRGLRSLASPNDA